MDNSVTDKRSASIRNSVPIFRFVSSAGSLFGFFVLVVFTLCATAYGQNSTDAVEGSMTEIDRINLERNLRWVLSREQKLNRDRSSGLANAARIGVFADAGVWHAGARSIVDSLEAEKLNCRVLDRSLIDRKALAELDAIVLPGGWAPLQWAALGIDRLKLIEHYVQNGGRCLGVCAGACLISKTVNYDDRDYSYPLELFDGSAVGPVYGLARFPLPGSVRLTATDAGKERGIATIDRFECYFSGGPHFVGGTQCQILARYPDGSSAAICRPYGKGEIVLIGGHLERPPNATDDSLPPPANAGKMLRKLLRL